MASSSDLSVAQVQSALLETIEKDHDLRASLAAIAERIHEHPANAEKTPIQDWQEWLDDEGYDTAALHQFIGTLLDSGLISNSIRGVKADASAGELISLMQRENPNLLDSILHSIDHSLQIHQELFGLAGGTARQPIANALSIGQKKKEMATREAAAESAMSMSREAPTLTDTTSVMGRDGAGQQKEYSRALDGVRTEVKASEDARAEFRKTDPGMMGATEKREFRGRQPVDGLGGVGEDRGYARAMDERNAVVDRRDIEFTVGEEVARESVDRALAATVDRTVDRLTNEISDLGSKIPDSVRRELSAHMQQISTAFKMGAFRPEVERAEFSIAERSMADLFSASRELEKVLPKAEHDRLMRQVDSLKDVVGVALNVGAAEKREPREVQPMDGRGGAGEEREYARAIDAVRELLERRDTILGPDGEQDRLSRVVDDLRQAIESRRDNLISEQGRLSRAVDAVREALDRRDTMVGPGGEQDERLDRAVDALRDALTPSRGDARAEFRETDPGMMGATEKREPREVQPMDGRGGAGEERGYARAMDERRDMVRDERLDMLKKVGFKDARESVDRALAATVELTVDKLTKEVNDLSAMIPDNVRRELSAHMQQISTAFKMGAFRPEVERAEFSIAERSMADLFSASRELEKVLPKAEHDRLMRQVDSLKDVVGVALNVGATEKREPREVQPMDGRGGAGEERGYARAMDERRDMVRDERLDMVKGITFDDARETVDRALKATVDLTVDRLKYEISDLSAKIPDSVRRELSAHMQQISTAFKDGAFRPEVERAEFSIAERSMADLFSASRELEKVLPKAEHDRLMRQVDSLKDVVGVALNVGAAEKREPREVQPMDGRGGAGEEREYARAIDAVRELLERRDTILGPDGEQDRLSRVVDDLRQAIESRRDNLISDQGRLSRAVDAVREAMDRRDTIVGPGGEQDVRLKMALDDLKRAVDVALDPNPAARAEMRDTEPGELGAPAPSDRRDQQRIREIQPVDGRNGAGEERVYARAIDAVRELLERRDTIVGPDGEQDRLSRVVDDLRGAIDGRLDLNSEQGRLSRAVDAVREAMDRRDTIVGPGGEQDVRLKMALDDLKEAVYVALDPNPAARRAELRRAPALSDRPEKQLDREIQPVDGRNGAGEEREYARAIDAVRELLERRDTILGPGGEQDRLSRVVDDLRQAIESRRENIISEQGRLSRAVDAVREALDRRNTIVGPGGEQDVRLDRALDALRDQLYLPNIRGSLWSDFNTVNSAGKEPRLLSMDMRDFEFDQKDLELQREIDRLTIPKDLNDQLSDALKNLKATTEMMLLGKMEPIDVNGAVRVVRDSLEAATKYVGIDDSERLADRVDELEATIADIAVTATAIKKTQNLALNLKMEIDIKRLEKDLGALELTANVKSAIDTSLKSSLENLERFMVDGADSSERDMLEKLDASLKETRATIEESKELMSLADHARVIDQIKRLGERVEFRKERMGELISVEAMDARMAMKLLDVRRGLSDMIANTAEARDLDRLERLRFDVNEALRSFNEPMIKEARPPMDASKARLANEKLAVAEICVASIGLAQEAKKANIREEDRMAFEAVANMPKRMIEDTQEDIEATLNDLTDRISPYDDGGYIPEYKEVEDRTNLADKIEPYNATGRLTLQDRLNELTRAYRNYRDVAGRNGVGEEKEYARILDSLRSPDTAPRAEFQETKPGMMGATSRGSEARYVPLVDSLRNLESDLESEVELNQEVRNTGQQDSPLNKAMKQTLDCMDNARL